MSFSKAKIQRFNDIKDCTPSPAKYNVASQEKSKLGIIPKIGRYMKKPGSPPNSETGSVHSTPCFQTPTVPLRKKKILGMSFRSSKSVDHEELREKIVECNNKDVFIKDLTEQIEEMTEKMNNLQREHSRLQGEKNDCEETISKIKRQSEEESRRRAKEYNGVSTVLSEVNKELRQIRQKSQDLQKQNCAAFSKLLEFIETFQELHDKTVNELKKQHKEETEEFMKTLEEKEAKINQLEENFKDVNLLTELQMNDRIQEIEAMWRQKVEDKEKEYEAILKECQAISEYSIIQSEIEKNHIKKILDEKVELYEAIITKHQKLEEDMSNLKTEKHAYELSITTFRDTIEVLKKRLINSDRDVEQLKEELERCEAKILQYERKCTELSTQLNETQLANDELEMQYESTSKIMQNQVEAMEKKLLTKVEILQGEAKQLLKDKELLDDVLTQHHEQQVLIGQAQEAIIQSNSFIESLEHKQIELEAELNGFKMKLGLETEEAAEIRKKYIEKSGKYDALAQQFEQLLQELDEAKGKNMDLEAKNYKANVLVEKLIKEIDDLRKPGKKIKKDKENLASPKCVKVTHSPGPLKEKN